MGFLMYVRGILSLFVVLSMIFVQANILLAQRHLKKIVAVENFEDRSGTKSDYELGSTLSDMLTDSFIKSGNYIVMERMPVQSGIEQQDSDLAENLSNPENIRQFAKMPPVQFLIKGTISEFIYNDGGEPDVNVRGFSLNMNKGKADISLIIRIIDTSTGQVIDSEEVEGVTESTPGLDIRFDGGELLLGQKDFLSSPVGLACRTAVEKAYEYITDRIKNIPWEGKIIDVKDNMVVINSGDRVGIQKGDLFDVLKKGDEFVDPDTGMTLGSDLIKIGQVKVVEVNRKFCKAIPISGSGFRPKNIVRFVNE